MGNDATAPITVAIYTRVSTDEQFQEGTSIETQREFLQAWAKLQGCTVYGEYSDPGYSGSTPNRPGFQRMLRDAEAGHFQRVAVTKLDRFKRDARELLNSIEDLDRLGVAFVAIREGVDTSDKGTGRLILTILAAIAEWEKDLILERTTEGRLATARKGGLLGGFVAYGFEYVPRSDGSLAHYVINERKATVALNMFGWVVDEQMSCRAISARLKERGILSPTGMPVWSPSVINRMLRQEIYCGTAYYRRRSPAVPQKRKSSPAIGKNSKSSRRLRPKEDWIAIPVPPIVNRSTWDRAQEQVLANSKFSPRNKKRHYLLSELTRCGICRYAYTGYGKTEKNRYYGCSKKDPLTAPDGKKCPGRPVHAAVLEQLVWNATSELFRDPDILAEELQRRKNESASDDKNGDEHGRLEAELRRSSTQADQLLDLYLDGRYERGALDLKMEQVNAQRRAAEIGISSLENKKDEAGRSSNALKTLESFCQAIGSGLDKMSFSERQKFLRLVVDRATIYPTNIIRVEIAIPVLPPDPVFGLRTTRPPPSPPSYNLTSQISRAGAFCA
jgi:site-specific DNA recombinase